MSLEDRILALPKRTPGQHDTVVKAATLAAEADELIAELVDALNFTRVNEKVIKDALKKHRKWKEQNQ